MSIDKTGVKYRVSNVLAWGGLLGGGWLIFTLVVIALNLSGNHHIEGLVEQSFLGLGFSAHRPSSFCRPFCASQSYDLSDQPEPKHLGLNNLSVQANSVFIHEGAPSEEPDYSVSLSSGAIAEWNQQATRSRCEFR